MTRSKEYGEGKYIHYSDNGTPMVFEYFELLPDAIPPDRVLVHDTVRPTDDKQGTGATRAFLSLPDPERLEACICGWAAHLGEHFRVKRG